MSVILLQMADFSHLRWYARWGAGHFDTEYVSDPLWLAFRSATSQLSSNDPLHILDVGGGNGVFADRLLAEFPRATVIVLEPASALLSKNTRHDQKILIEGGIELLKAGSLPFEQFDLICFNWVLHHLIEDSANESRRAQTESLQKAASILSPKGLISIFENGYSAAVPLAPSPGNIIFHLTSSKRLRWLTQLGGANTAGIGVLFRSKESWLDVLRAAGLRAIHQQQFAPWRFSMLKRICLNIGNVRTILLVAEPSGDGASLT